MGSSRGIPQRVVTVDHVIVRQLSDGVTYEVLLGEHKKLGLEGKIGIVPGGKMEMDQDVLETLEKETWEEVEMRIDPQKAVLCRIASDPEADPRWPRLGLVFITVLRPGDTLYKEQGTCGPELKRIFWHPLDMVMGLDFMADHKLHMKAVRHYLRTGKVTIS